jgi:phenylalanyl-tRNA synthetase alpha chain
MDGITNEDIKSVALQLEAKVKNGEPVEAVIKSKELKNLMAKIPSLAPEDRAEYGKQVNELKKYLMSLGQAGKQSDTRAIFDVTAPYDESVAPDKRPGLLRADMGGVHPITKEIEIILDVFYRMGFVTEDPRQLDDDFHMFGSLNFPESHPARDDYDTFVTSEGFLPPAHTSTMQNRVLKKYKAKLKNDDIRVVLPGRVYRNEDLDATHEHTFHQIEGVVVGENINIGHLVAALKEFLSQYFGEELAFKLQPSYFPFTEPSLEFAIEKPSHLRKDNSEEQRWLELVGCGMIHPNVLKMADIDPEKYAGFAWGFGVDRLVMMKYGIEDVRHFMSSKLDFLRQF